MLPRGGAEQAVQALAIGGLARRRSRAMSWAAAASAADAAGGALQRREARPAIADGDAHSRAAATRRARQAVSSTAQCAPRPPARRMAAMAHRPKPRLRRRPSAARRARKPKQQGLPEGWVIDEEGFVVPGAG